MKDIKAIAFDIDGTLYPNWRLNIRIIPYLLKHIRFFLAFKKVRDVLHQKAPEGEFFDYQAKLLSEILHCDSSKAKDLIQKIVYDGLAPFFNKIKPYKNAIECFELFKKAGYKCAILSDFPPLQKGRVWGAVDFCDVVLGSEEIGALKPSAYTFAVLAEKLELEAHEILYVGNNIWADIIGAKKAGMKTAYLLPFWRKILGLNCSQADISFKNYRILQKTVLK